MVTIQLANQFSLRFFLFHWKIHVHVRVTRASVFFALDFQCISNLFEIFSVCGFRFEHFFRFLCIYLLHFFLSRSSDSTFCLHFGRGYFAIFVFCSINRFHLQFDRSFAHHSSPGIKWVGKMIERENVQKIIKNFKSEKYGLFNFCFSFLKKLATN